MSGYQEVATDPSFEGQIVCFTAPMVGNYGVDETRNESRRAHAKAVVMRDARGPEWTDWLHERGVVGAHRRRHPLARPAPARPRRDAGGRRDRRHVGRRGARRGARAAGDGRRGARRRRLGARAVHVRRRGAGAGRGRRLRLQALDPAPARGERRRRRRLPARRRRRHGRRLRRRAALARPRRSRAARGRDEDAASSCSAARRCSGSASAISCSRSRPARRRSSCRSAIAAPTTRCSTIAAAACSSPSQNHGFAVAAGDESGVTHSSLYDGTVEGPRLPGAPRPLGAVPPGGCARPARRGVDHQRLGRGAEVRCLGAPI